MARLAGQFSTGAMTLLVCLCGSPLAPDIGGVRSGHTFNTELVALLPACTKSSIPTLVCMCGHPILIGKLRRQSVSRRDWDVFQRSFESALRCRKAAEPQNLIDRISPTSVTREEYAKLAEQIANLETILRVRLPDSTPLPVSTRLANLGRRRRRLFTVGTR